jgi:hypothetical protein
MANSFKTRDDGDVLRLMLESFHNKQTFLKTCNRQYDKYFGQEGRKNAGSIFIKNPNEYTVGETAVVSVQNVEETTQEFTVAYRANVAVTITSYERTMSEDDFKQEVADPAMLRLAAKVEHKCMATMFPQIWNQTGTPATTPVTMAAIQNARARLVENLAPEDDLHVILNPPAMAGIVGGANAAYFHAASELERGFLKGYYGEGAGFKWWESTMIPTHTNGTRDDTTITAAPSTWANGDTSIVLTGASGTYTVGDIFTVATVYDCNQETKDSYDRLKQFVVTAANTNDGTDTISVYPTIYVSGAKQNVYMPTAGATDAVVNLTAGGSGAASAVHPLTMAYHRNAFSVAFANLPTAASGNVTQKTIEGIPMRMWQFSDGINDTHTTRFDVLYGCLALRKEWASVTRG